MRSIASRDQGLGIRDQGSGKAKVLATDDHRKIRATLGNLWRKETFAFCSLRLPILLQYRCDCVANSESKSYELRKRKTS